MSDAATWAELSALPVTELVDRFRSGEVTPVDAARAALWAIEELDDQVHAIVLLDPESGLRDAQAATERWRRGEPLGPADGVPTTVKDILLTKGWPTLRGSTLVDEAGPWEEDAPSVARLRESGGVMLGKNATPEFAWKGVTDSARHGATGNPWDAGLTAGGSSGGAATAVGLGMSAWAVGTDGGGSVRIPASFTGTVALKPTMGIVPMFPSSPYGTLGHAGPMTRTVTDAALMMDVVGRSDDRDWSWSPRRAGSYLDGLDDGVAGLRVAWSPTLGFGHNDPEVERLVAAAVQVLAEAGAHVEQVDPPITDPREAFELLWFTGAGKVLAPYGEDASKRVDPLLGAQVERFASATARDYLDATAVRMDLGRAMGGFHQHWDLLVTPTMPIAAFPVGQDAPDGWPSSLWTTWTPYTYPFNMTMQPALSAPCGFTSDGRPVGMQLVGSRHADDLVLRAGRAYEQRTDWHTRIPRVRAGREEE